MPTPKNPWIISGTVTVGGTAFQGAKVWLFSGSYAQHVDTVKDATYYYTDSKGKYILDVSNFVSAVTNADVVTVMCQAGDQKTYAEVTIDTSSGGTTQDFTFSNLSGLTDGLKDTPNTDGTDALLSNQLKKGTLDGMT